MTATREQLDNFTTYKLDGPRLNMDVPPHRVPFGHYGRLSGIDGRFGGCLRKFYGMLEVVELADVSGLEGIATYDGVSFIQNVIFQKRGTATVYRGFVVRWDARDDTEHEEVGLAYTENGGTSWSYLAIWTGAGTGITDTTPLEAATDRGYLMVAVDGKACMTVYWTGAALAAVASGPGAFSATLTALTLAGQAEDTDHFLTGAGVYQVCWRFYSSTRGIYSAMSDPVTVYLNLPKLAPAHGAVYFSVYGDDAGLLVSGDIITLNGRTFEYLSAGSDVTIPAAGAATVSAHAQALADAINGDTDNCGCTARAESAAVYLEASTAGAAGNTMTLSVTEAAPNQNDLSVSGSNLVGGGAVTAEYLAQCQAVMDFPAHAAVVAAQTFAGFDALFDTVDIYRSIDLGSIPAAQEHAVFWYEQSIAKGAHPGGAWHDATAWDALQVTIGTSPDAALAADPENMYDPSKDAIVAPPASGAIARYQGITLMAQALADDDPYDILVSSLTHVSPEYFTTYNQRKGKSGRGRPLRFIEAGDSAFALHPAGFTHIYQSGGDRGIQFVDTINKVGLDGKWAAHSMGNSIVMISAGLLRLMGGNDANVSDVPGVGRLLADDWQSDLADQVSSGYDARLNASLFLDSARAEILLLWHGTGGLSLLEGANFRWMTSGPNIADGGVTRAYFVTRRGRIVRADVDKSGTGTMQGLADGYTLSGSVTGGTDHTLVSAGATFHDDMVGARVYMIDGDNAGDWVVISRVTAGTCTLTLGPGWFRHSVGCGDRFVISPVPVHIELSAIRTMDSAEPLVSFDRHKMSGLKAKLGKITGGPNVKTTHTIRVGAYRNADDAIETPTAEMALSDVIKNAACAFDKPVDGLDVMPYLEYLGVGTSFEITDIEISKDPTDSKQVE